MEIQTERARNPPVNNIERGKLETRKAALGVDNRNVIKSARKSGIHSSARKKEYVLVKPRKIHGIVRVRKKSRFIYHENKIMTAKPIGNTLPTGGTIRTAVNSSRERNSRIHTGINIQKSKSVVGIKSKPEKSKRHTPNVIKDGVNRLIKTEVDHATTTDTGTEAAKYAISNVRRGKSLLKTAVQGSVSAVREVEKTPAAVRQDVRKIREKMVRSTAARRKRRLGKKSRVPIISQGTNAPLKITSMVGSKGKKYLIIAVLALLLIFVLIFGFVPMIMSVISGIFSWTVPDGDTTQSELFQGYRDKVERAEDSIIAEIDDEVGYVPEYRYDGTEITSLKQYGDVVLNVDENAVVAAAAVLQFSEGSDDIPDEKIAEIIRDFFEIEVTKTNDYCDGHDCKKTSGTLSFDDLTLYSGDFGSEYELEINGGCYEHTSSVYIDAVMPMDGGEVKTSGYAEVSGSGWRYKARIPKADYEKIKWEDMSLSYDTVYCDNPEHTKYFASVKYNSNDAVFSKLGFTEEQKDMYYTYYECMNNGGF